MVDPDGEDVYLITHSAGYGNITPDEMRHTQGNNFKLNAEADRGQIMKSSYYNPKTDQVVIAYTPSTRKITEATNKKYPAGKIARWHHHGHGYSGGLSLGGELGNNSQLNDYDKREINSVTVSLINKKNFVKHPKLRFNGCNTAYSKESAAYVIGTYLDAEESYGIAGVSKFKTDINGKNIYDGTMIPQYIYPRTGRRVNNTKNAMDYLNYKDIP